MINKNKILNTLATTRIPYIVPKIKNKGCVGIHGAREMERRKRQIARGQLKAENGLVV